MACAVDHVRENHVTWSRRGTAFLKSLLPSKPHDRIQKCNWTRNGRCDSNLAPLYLYQDSPRIHRITPETYHNLDSLDVTQRLLRRLEQAMDLYESDNVLQARKAQLQVFEAVVSLKHPEVHFKPTKLGLRVMKRAKESFLRNGISCWLLHGTILLDTSDSATQFYASFLNVLGAFAVETSDFRIASETFKLSIDVYQKSGYTSRSRDLGVACNNMGCISTIMGEFKKAETYLTESVNHFEVARKTAHVPQSEQIEVQVVAVHNNISRLCMLERNYETAFRLLAHLVDLCKSEMNGMLPVGTVLVVIQNQAKLHVTLRNFKSAETELQWMKSFYGERNDLLIKYISLHLCEVTLLRGKEEEDIFNLDTLNYAGVRHLVFLNGNMHDNLTVATLERLTDVLVHKGKLTVACMVLEESVQNCKDIFGQTHFHAASLLCKKASVLRLMGDIAASIDIFKSALSIWLEIFDFNHPVIMKCHAAIADMLAFKGNKDESHLYCERTVENIEAIYQVSFSRQLSVKFSDMMTNQRRTPFVFTKRRSAEDIKIQGLVVDFGAQLALIMSSRYPSTKDRKQDWQPPDRGRDGKRLKEPFPPLAVLHYFRSQCSGLLVIPKFIYDLSQSGQCLARCGMTKESAAFLQTANLLCEKYADSLDNTELLRTLLCCWSSQTSAENALFPKRKDIVYKYIKELKDRAKAKEPSDCLGTRQEDVEQSLCGSHLKLKIFLLIKASIEMNILDATFAAYDLYSSVFPDNGDFIRVYDGLQIYASRTPIVCNGKSATHDLLIATSVGPGQDNEPRSSDPSLFKTLAYKTGATSGGFLVTAGANSLIDIEHLEQLKLRSLHSVKELFQRMCFENMSQEKPIRFLAELNVPFSAEGVSSSNVSDVDLLALCFSKTFPEAREGICEISAEKTCEMFTYMIFSDAQTSSFLFVKALQYLLQHCSGTEIDTVSIRNEGVVLSFFKPAKARLTVWCEDKNVNQRTQVLSTTHRIVENHRSYDASTRTFGPCSCNHFSGLFLQAVEYCSSMYNVAYETVVVKQMCTSLSGLGERSLVDDTAVQVKTSEFQPRSRRPYLYCEQTLVQEQNRRIRDFLRTSLFNVFEAHSIVSGIVDKELPPWSEVSAGIRSDHDSNGVDDLNSRLLLQHDVKDVTSASSTPSQSKFQASANGPVLEFSLHMEEIDKERGHDNETEYGRWRFEEDQKLRRFQVAECQRELERKRSEKSHLFVVSKEGKTIQTTINKTAELGTTTGALQSESLALQQKGANGCPQRDADSFGKHTTHTSAFESKNENEESTKESPNTDTVIDSATSDERGNGYNETPGDHFNKGKNMDFLPYSSNSEISGCEENQQCKETSMDVLPSPPNIERSGCEDQQCNVPSPTCPDPFKPEFKSSDLKIVHAFDSERSEEMMKTDCEVFVECKRLHEKAGVARYHDEPLSDKNERSTDDETGTSTREVSNGRDTAPMDVTRVLFSVEGVGKRNAEESDQGNGDPVAEEENSLFKLQLGKTVDTSDEDRDETPPEYYCFQNPKIASDVEDRDETLPEYYCFQNPKIASDVESSFQENDVSNDCVCQGGSDSNTASVVSNQSLLNGNDPQWDKSQSSNEQITATIATRYDWTNYSQPVSGSSSTVKAGDERVGIGEEKSTALELSLMYGYGCQGGGFREVVSEQGNEKRTSTKKIHDKTLASAGKAGDKNSQIGEETLLKVSKKKEIHECHHPKSVSRLPFQGGDVIADSGYEDVSSCCSNTSPVLSANEDVTDGPVLRHGSHSNQNEYGQLTYFGNGKSPDISSKKETKCNTYSFEPLGIQQKGKTVKMKPNCSDTGKVRGTRPKIRAKPKMPVPNLSQQSEGIDPGFLARHIGSEDACFFTPSMERWNCNSVEYSGVDATGTRDVERSNGLSRLYGMDYTRRHFDKDFYLRTERDFKDIRIMGVNPVIGTSIRGITSNESSAKLQDVNQVLPANVVESWHFPSPPSKECLLRQNDYDDTPHPGIPHWEDSSDIAHRQIAPHSEGIYEDASLHHLGQRFSSMINQNNSFSETITDSLTSRASNLSQINSNSVLLTTHHQLSVLGEVISKTVELAALKERLNEDLKRNAKEAAQRAQFTEERVIKERADLDKRERDELNQEDELQRMEMQSLSSPVQESPPYSCGHYQRRCKVKFPCCNEFYPCHRCHNESDACSEEKAKAVHATHLECTACYHKQEIDEGGQWCRGCNLKMADYFCAICKHFTALDKNPFHCDKCGICRIHKEKSFHCDVCNVCLDKRLQGKHKCRPDSGHDECCICLEDAFGGCQILPCSHKVHKDCAVAMVQNGVRSCPVCRYPLTIPLQDGGAQ